MAVDTYIIHAHNNIIHPLKLLKHHVNWSTCFKHNLIFKQILIWKYVIVWDRTLWKLLAYGYWLYSIDLHTLYILVGSCPNHARVVCITGIYVYVSISFLDRLRSSGQRPKYKYFHLMCVSQVDFIYIWMWKEIKFNFDSTIFHLKVKNKHVLRKCIL